jgi:hypothetical protein
MPELLFDILTVFDFYQDGPFLTSSQKLSIMAYYSRDSGFGGFLGYPELGPIIVKLSKTRRILAEIIQRQNEAKKTQKIDRFYASEKGQKNAQNSPFLTVLALFGRF